MYQNFQKKRRIVKYSQMQLNGCVVTQLKIRCQIDQSNAAESGEEYVSNNVSEREEAGAKYVQNEVIDLIEPEISFDFSVVEHEGSTNRFLVLFETSLTWPQKSRSNLAEIVIELLGDFSLPDHFKDEEINKYVPTLCITNLYSTARGLIAQSTGMFPGGSFYLPLIDMHDVVREKYEAIQASRPLITETSSKK